MITTEQQLYFRTQLEQQRQTLRAAAANVQRQISEPDVADDIVSDYGDDGNILFARELAMNELARLTQTLAHIEHALHRLETGSYGYSEVSGQPIPIERLEALPYATTLVDEHAPEP